MCLAVPGKIISIRRDESDPIEGLSGTVDFQGSYLDVNLAMTPEVAEGDWVLVHAGFAISMLDAHEARETWEYLESSGIGTMPDDLRQGAESGRV